MNVLELTGPEFLRFYIPYGLCVVALAWLLRALLDRASGAPPSARWTPGAYPREGDAYAIAFLRDGKQEAVRTVLGRLVSAGLVNVEDRLVRALPQSAPAQLQPIEAAALSAFKPGEPLRVGKAEQRVQEALGVHLHQIETELTHEGLLPDPERKTTFRALAVVAWLAVVGLGLAKLAVAISRGRSNVGFLILLLIGFWILIVRLMRRPRQTRAGRQYLDWLQESHRGLVQMLGSGRRDGAGEMALAAGIYGLTAVPGLSALETAFQPPRPQKSHDSSSSSSGGGCGSGSSDSGGGGSSCGGGCGGGGCGGCGG